MCVGFSKIFVCLDLLLNGKLHCTADFETKDCYNLPILLNTIMSNDYGFNSDDSPNKTASHLQIPSPIITRRNRTASTSERALGNPLETGKIKSFCREKGHGFVTPTKGGEDLFVHISDVEGEYVPLPGDEVIYRLCPIPPKFEKFQAVHVCIVHLIPEKHHKWDEPRCQ